MRFWQSLIFAETEQLLEIARTADDLGFTGLVLPAHIALPDHTETSYPYSDYDLEPTRTAVGQARHEPARKQHQQAEQVDWRRLKHGGEGERSG